MSPAQTVPAPGVQTPARRPPAEAGANANTCRAQRARILARLQCGPCDAATLAAECWVPCVTKRLSELRREGCPIRTTWAQRTGPDGTASVVAVYALAQDQDPRQLPLPL